MRPYRGRHLASGAAVWTPAGRQTGGRPMPAPSTDRAHNAQRVVELVSAPVYRGRHAA